ncbi:MAG: FAD-dependent oxidoreductase [Acidobacteria bacterium]|nr:FAD-dependent oxidoreductase [Acidobacteriota bacterium]
MAILRAAHVPPIALRDEHWKPAGRGRWKAVPGIWQTMDAITSRMRNKGRDRSVREFLSAQKCLSSQQRWLLLSLVEGYRPGGVGAREALARAVAGTLFFAGEATDPEQNGTVAGALASGQRAAAQVVRALGRGRGRR